MRKNITQKRGTSRKHDNTGNQEKTSSSFNTKKKKRKKIL